MLAGGEATVTVKVRLALFPTLSIAVAVTVVVPTGKMLPLAGEYVTTGVPRLSVALAPLKVTATPLADIAVTLNVPGTVNTGGTVSTTPATDSVQPTESEARPRANRNPRLLFPNPGRSP
jgi:hypothetical protein